MKRTLIYLTIAVVVLTLITTVLMFSTSGTAPIKLYWAVTCESEDNCNLKISGGNFIGEVANPNETNATENSNPQSGSISVEKQALIDKPSEVIIEEDTTIQKNQKPSNSRIASLYLSWMEMERSVVRSNPARTLLQTVLTIPVFAQRSCCIMAMLLFPM